ncbi:MAG: hypothetical protein HYY06_12785 [Deltaproteobacteria bacterium]|nr:hypothetical protein [Deltaproteobacteria bacterium]
MFVCRPAGRLPGRQGPRFGVGHGRREDQRRERYRAREQERGLGVEHGAGAADHAIIENRLGERPRVGDVDRLAVGHGAEEIGGLRS